MDTEEMLLTAETLGGFYNQHETELDILRAELDLCQDDQERMIVIQDIDVLMNGGTK